jgi:general stress protein CsbA
MFCSIGSATVSIVFSAVMIAATFGPGYLPVSAIVAIVAGSLTYLTIWMAWTLNSKKLSRKGHRW